MEENRENNENNWNAGNNWNSGNNWNAGNNGSSGNNWNTGNNGNSGNNWNTGNNGSNGNRPNRPKKPKMPKVSVKPLPVLIGLLAVLIVLVGMNGYYKVDEQEQAVVTMFGKVTDVKTAGLYFKIPFVQQVQKVDTTTKGMQIGYTQSNDPYNQRAEVVEYEALMITSDFNFVDIDFYLEYRVSDPKKYLYRSTDPVAILRNLTQESIRSTVSDYTVDEVITTGKNQIQAKVREKLVESLEEADIGLEVVNLSIQDAEPPTSEVMQAFKAVETAKQGADTAVNNAKQYQNEQIPAAEANADKITQQAEAAKEARIAEAEGQTARFNAMYEQYVLNPTVTRQRLFYETMEDVLPGLKVIVDDGQTQTILPLDSFSENVTVPAGSGEKTEGGDQ